MEVFDGHCDTILRCYLEGGGFRERPGHLDLTRTRKFSRYAQFFACFGEPEDMPGRPLWEVFQEEVALFRREMEQNADWVVFCRSGREAEAAFAGGRAAAFLSAEGAELLDCDLDKLRQAHAWGVRAVNLTWNHPNALSGTNAEERERGLSSQGRAFVREMQRLGRAYPDKGYGARFNQWLYEDDPQPYRSYGNGSAMRVSPAAWLAESIQEALHLAQLTAEVTHDHPEGIKGAQAVAAAIFLARTGHSKVEIKAYVECKFGYDLSRTCDEIRPTYHHVESCQETVPQAIAAFLESTDFEDALRTAVSLGGDSDTLAAITGSIAEAFYGVPENLKQECRKRLTPELEEILQACENMLLQR